MLLLLFRQCKQYKLPYLDLQLVLMKWGWMVELLVAVTKLLMSVIKLLVPVIKLLVADFPLLPTEGLLHPSLLAHHV